MTPEQTKNAASKNLESLRYFNNLIKNQDIIDLNNIVLNDHRFFTSPGGSEHHHNYKHGLVIHVFQVFQNCCAMTNNKPSAELLTAVIWHDYKKILDYSISETGDVIKMPYRKLINHVAGSWAEFYHQAILHNISDDFIINVGHLLLSHHGRKEWGSPIEPITTEAFILHAADMMSAKGGNL